MYSGVCLVPYPLQFVEARVCVACVFLCRCIVYDILHTSGGTIKYLRRYQNTAS